MSEDLLEIPAFLKRGADGKRPSTGHAVLSPSSAERWMKCPGSVRLSAQLPNRTSTFAQEGTDAHQLAAHCLIDGSDAWEHVGSNFGRGDGTFFQPSTDMADAVQVYLDVIRGDILSDDATGKPDPNCHKTEVKFDLNSVVPQVWGTSDRAGYFPRQRLVRIYDYKHGVGIAVDVIENPQLKIYGAGAVHELSSKWDDIDEVELVIVQPRGFHPDGTVRRWRLKLSALGEWVSAELAPAAKRALMDDAPIGPADDYCRFCPARLVCPVLTASFEEALVTPPTDIKPMETWELAERYENIQKIKFYVAALEDEVFSRLRGGEEVPGAKLVAKKSDRVWKDGAEVRLKETLGDRAYDAPKLKTPAAMEKVRDGKELVKELAYKPDAGVTVAAADDKRPAVTIKTAREVFAGIDGGAAAQ